MTYKVSHYIFCIALVLCVPLRVIQLIFAVEKDTGFYIRSGHWSIPVLTVLMIIAIAGLLIIQFFCKLKTTDVEIYEKKSVSISSLIVAAGFFISAGYEFFQLFSGAVTETYIQTTRASEATAILDFIVAILAVFSGLFFVAAGIRPFLKTKNYKLKGIFSLIPVMWAASQLFYSFMQYTSIKNVSQNLLDVLTMIFVMFFLLANARVLAGVKSRKGLRYILSVGYAAGIFAIVSTLPMFLSTLILQSGALSSTMVSHIVNLAIGIYIFFVTEAVVFDKLSD